MRFALLLALLASACATDICARRDAFFARSCVGTDVSYTPDAMCRERIEHCSVEQREAFAAYVQCLETANRCSMEVVASCARRHPGGVNLSCADTDG
ncbi:MAG: hypothetical protein AAGD10_01505 [Myxococcota bacterium]